MRALLLEPRSLVRRALTPEARAELTFMERACTSKLAFRSRAAASRFIQLHPPTERRPRKLHAYECPHCKQWHTTTQAGSR